MKHSEITGQANRRIVAPVTIHPWASVDAFLVDQKESKHALASWDALLALPVRTNLPQAIRLGMQCMNSMFDCDRNEEPFFYSECRADGTGVLLHAVNIGIPHIVGRAFWGTRIGAKATGYPSPEPGLEILERYCHHSFDNPEHLNAYYDPARGNRRFIEFHNMREGLYGLVALIEGCRDEWARRTAHQMLVTLDSITDPQGRWSADLAAKHGMAGIVEGLPPVNAGRMVDPLVAYYRLTSNPLALKLAGLYARNALDAAFDAGGRFKPMASSSGHIHSITSCLSGITAYAILTKDAGMLERCRQVIDRGVPEYFSSWGWGDEVMPEHPANEVGRGEINQTGDVIRTALLLGQAVTPRYYDLAERFLRSMLLPAQHRDAEMRRFMHDNPHPKDDSEREVIRRSVGGFSMPLPNDRMRAGDWPLATIDVTSGAVHALAECLMQAVTSNKRMARVNLLIDSDRPDLRVTSRLPFEGRIEFQMKAAKNLLIRIPPWVRARSVKVEVGDRPVPVVRSGAYVKIAGLAAGAHGAVTFEIPCKTEQETVDGTEYTTTWIGNQIISIEPRGAVSPLPW